MTNSVWKRIETRRAPASMKSYPFPSVGLTAKGEVTTREWLKRALGGSLIIVIALFFAVSFLWIGVMSLFESTPLWSPPRFDNDTYHFKGYGLTLYVATILGSSAASFFIFVGTPKQLARRRMEYNLKVEKNLAYKKRQEERAYKRRQEEAEQRKRDQRKARENQRIKQKELAAKRRKEQLGIISNISQLPVSATCRIPRDADDFESVCAEWMKKNGFPDAARTPKGPDGGIDVVSGIAVAQAKFHPSQRVGAPEIQAIVGGRVQFGKKLALFFHYGPGYSDQAIAAAKKTRVALYQLNVQSRSFDRIG